jgi:polyisoprenoid-binding protein YceI
MKSRTFIADIQQSKIIWTGKKIKGEHTGTINLLSGKIETEEDKIVSGNFEIDTTSIKITDIKDVETNQQFAGHLASDDFFSIDKYPKATFALLNANETEKGNLKIDGNLNIKGVIQSQSIEAAVIIEENIFKIKAQAIVDRTKFNMRFRSGNFFQNLGDNLIHNDFALDLFIILKAD